jgi:hypothetical protein
MEGHRSTAAVGINLTTLPKRTKEDKEITFSGQGQYWPLLYEMVRQVQSSKLERYTIQAS